MLNVIGQLDPKGRMAQVLIEVDNPLETNDETPVPLLLGAYVKVEIRGRTMNNVFRLPQQALRQGDRVYVMDAQARLSIRKVQVLRMENDSVLIRGGLKPDEQVVTSRLETAVAGMKLKAVNTEPDNE